MDISDLIFLATAMMPLMIGFLLVIMARYLLTSSLQESSLGIKENIRRLYVTRPYVSMTVIFLLPLIGALIMWLGYLFVVTELSISPSYGILISSIVVLGLWGAFNLRKLNSNRGKNHHMPKIANPCDS